MNTCLLTPGPKCSLLVHERMSECVHAYMHAYLINQRRHHCQRINIPSQFRQSLSSFQICKAISQPVDIYFPFSTLIFFKLKTDLSVWRWNLNAEAALHNPISCSSRRQNYFLIRQLRDFTFHTQHASDQPFAVVFSPSSEPKAWALRCHSERFLRTPPSTALKKQMCLNKF